jgi:diguanylate cyclase (GGDEF)-like protein
MMEDLLTHLVQITGHRDHTLLDASMLSALHQLVGVAEVRVLEIVRLRDDLCLRQRLLQKAGTVTSTEDNSDTESGGELLADYPVLLSCIEERKIRAEETTSSGEHILWFPIWINDRVNNCVALSSTTPYSSHALNVIDGVLSVYRNFQSLLDYSERDSLTGLLNRKTFDENFSKMVACPPQLEQQALSEMDDRRHHAKSNKEQWLAVVDIDHFKRVNDQFGHLYGDEVLILVANLLRSSFRLQDRVFRFGGEEFVILLRSTTLEEARKIFDRFRNNIEQHVFPQVGKVTVSIGFSGISKATPVVILGQADQALYHAKANGRNQVCYYEELVSNGILQSQVSNDSVEFFFD